MNYQADNMAFNDAMDYLEHHGVLGMKWGVRNADTLRKYAGPKGNVKTTAQKVATGIGTALGAASAIGPIVGTTIAATSGMTGNIAGVALGNAILKGSGLLRIPASAAIAIGMKNGSVATRALLTLSGTTSGLGTSLTSVTIDRINDTKVPVLRSTPEADIYRGLGLSGFLGTSLSALYDSSQASSGKYKKAAKTYEKDQKKEVAPDKKTNAYNEAARAYIKEHPNTEYSFEDLVTKFENGWNSPK